MFDSVERVHHLLDAELLRGPEHCHSCDSLSSAAQGSGHCSFHCHLHITRRPLETLDSICTGAEIVTGAIDALIFGVLTSVAYVKAGIVACLTGIGQFADTTVSSVSGALNSLGQFWHLLGSSLLLLVNIIPKTIGYVYTTITSNIDWTFEVISQRTVHAWSSVHAAPFESLLGLVATVLIALSSQKLVRHLVVSRNLTWGWLAQLTLKLVCLVYLQFCLFLIALGTGIAR